MLRNIVWMVVLGALLAAPATLQAQEMEVQPRAQISISPILALFEIINGEAEYAFSDELSGVFGFGYVNLGSDTTLTYLATDLKLRFYPSGTPLEGFEISGIVGRTTVTNDSTDQSLGLTSIGVELGRHWLFGDAKRWFFGAAIGAKRYFGDDTLGGTDLFLLLPTGRLNFGVAF